MKSDLFDCFTRMSYCLLYCTFSNWLWRLLLSSHESSPFFWHCLFFMSLLQKSSFFMHLAKIRFKSVQIRILLFVIIPFIKHYLSQKFFIESIICINVREKFNFWDNIFLFDMKDMLIIFLFIWRISWKKFLFNHIFRCG